ncbi:hypothetical protein P4159_05955 [Bacillus thuringiensis]|uniref:hypothetical protein n=1 Tax=Bacillus cereus group TaxID=86661 RepID=UPI000CD86250|nr:MULTISPECIES: hypothetical protein [Bacillus cereus group]MEC3420817.1 hypothetical protein [Bacillus cereus]MEC3596948.1 hypothetical protein [Bacillus thuringiensis]MED1574297.1 hypothetical protein [Bacillus paranthracis]MED1836221.1 hypothetical protein [Bacillus thuringiensis]MED2670284.1 hypothetical protein [Bacillus thuringiensis]
MRNLVLKLLEDMETKRDFAIERVGSGMFQHDELHQEIGRLNATHEFVGELKRIIGEDDQVVH